MLEFAPDPGPVLSLAQLLQQLRESSVLTNVARQCYYKPQIALASQWLLDFARNQAEILAIICRELQAPAGFQSGNFTQPPTFDLYRHADFSIRLVLWLPPGPQSTRSPFLWQEAHDHNFDLFTTHFCGSGYATRVYEYDHDQVWGIAGEKVKLKSLGQRVLSRGKVLFFARNQDMHFQLPPADLSVSVNIMVKPHGAEPRQYEFLVNQQDHAQEQLGMIRLGCLQRLRAYQHLFAFMTQEGGERGKKLMLRLAVNHPRDELRALAWVALLQAKQDRYAHAQWLNLAQRDVSRFVKAQALAAGSGVTDLYSER